MTPQQTAEDRARELEPCPFCGEEADVEHLENGQWSVGCIDIDGECMGFQSLQTFARRADAITAWNTRAQSALSTRVIAGREEAVARIEAFRDAKAICERVRDESSHTEITTEDYRKGFYAGANGCVVSLFNADAILALPQSTPDREEQAQPVAEGLREALASCEIWLTAALECESWHWDQDQREAATESRDAARAALTPTQALDASREGGEPSEIWQAIYDYQVSMGLPDEDAQEDAYGISEAIQALRPAIPVSRSAVLEEAARRHLFEQGIAWALAGKPGSYDDAYQDAIRSLITNDAGGKS